MRTKVGTREGEGVSKKLCVRVRRISLKNEEDELIRVLIEPRLRNWNGQTNEIKELRLNKRERLDGVRQAI
jgi:hypothetical protein